MIEVWGIPNCGTVKKVRGWLAARGVAHSFMDLRATPPDAATVSAWVARFGAKGMKNTSGGSYRALGAEKDAWDERQWASAFIADPMLIKRPVVVRDGAPLLVGMDEAALTAAFGA